jgi:hypothetical protein
MDPISLIVGALAAGAATGLKDTVADGLKDAYAGLRGLVRRRFAGRPDAEMVLAKHEAAPEVWRAPLVAELEATGAGTDKTIIAAAQQVMGIVEKTSTRSGKYVVDLQGAQGVVIGDHNTQTNSFSSPAKS